MDLNVFVFFPQDETSICEIINDESSFKNFIKYTFELISKSYATNNVKLFYDSENIKVFLDTCEDWNNDVYLESANTQLRRKLNKATQIDIYSLRKTDCAYFIWNINSLVEATVPNLIQEVAEKFWEIEDIEKEKVLLLNLKETISADRHYIIVFKDALHLKNYPQGFARIPFISNLSEFELWVNTNHKSGFSLLDKSRFKRTSQVQQGQTVYEEYKTGYFWYLDNFHKDHYEVFNSIRKHIGVADLDGSIDFSKVDNARTF